MDSRSQALLVHINNKLFRKGDPAKLVLNPEEAIKSFQQFHNSPMGGHFAVQNTLSKISKRYYWPTMNKDVDRWVVTCPRCQLKGKETLREKLHPIPVPLVPFEQIAMDIKHVQQSRAGHRYIVVAIDYFSKWVEARPLLVANSIEVASFLLEEVISRHNTPKVIITDNGTPFSNQLISTICQEFHIKQRFISAYHASGNGLVERFNRTLGQAMRSMDNNYKDDWHLYLPLLLYAYRTLPQASTKFTPFMLLHGYEPLSQFDNQMSKEDEFPQDPVEFEQAVLVAFKHQLDKLTKVRKDASENILKAQKTQEKYVNRRIKTTKQSMQPPFQLGEMVLVYQDMIANNTSEKLQDRYAGPYIIHQVYQNSTYTLKTLAGQILPRHVHGNKLQIYKKPELPNIHSEEHKYGTPITSTQTVRWKPIWNPPVPPQ